MKGDTSKKVLIVEDEKPLSKALQLKLSRVGFTVEIVDNGKQALQKVQNTNYDLLILDIVMPELDGFGVLEGIKDMLIKPKVIVLSNLAQTEDAQRAKKLGADEYFIKSNTPLVDIVAHINKLLGYKSK